MSTARPRSSPPARSPPTSSTATPTSGRRWPGVKLPHDIYVQIAGIDIVRVDDKDFYVLEDNARTPSGVSYMLENREVMMRLFPGSLRRQPHRPGRELSGGTARDAEIGGAQFRAGRSDRRAADARPLQQRLLRALVPRRQARHRTGRGPRSAGPRQHRADAHHRGAEARRRALPPARRRLPRSRSPSARIRRSAFPA